MNSGQCITSAGDRHQRLEQALGPVTVSPQDLLVRPGPLVAVTSSRLGRDLPLQRRVCRFLCRSVLDCRQRGGTLLIAAGSAIEPWASRAAELFDVPVMRVRVNASSSPPDDATLRVSSEASLSRDAVVIALADRVDAIHVRGSGTIERCLRQRLASRCDAATRVAIGSHDDKVIADLIAAGAIGWYLISDRESEAATAVDAVPDSIPAWTQCEGQWLVHCTRGQSGPWPGESERQFRDAMLLGDSASARRGPLEALQRILRSGRLVASAIASDHRHPVVCFSAQPLQWLLAHRCYRAHLGRWDYEPFGIAIRITAARSAGIQPVIYGPPQQRTQLPAQQRYRFHPLGNTYDWTQEREWRADHSIDLHAFGRQDVRVFAPPTPAALAALADSPWEVTWVRPGR